MHECVPGVGIHLHLLAAEFPLRNRRMSLDGALLSCNGTNHLKTLDFHTRLV